MSTTRSTAMSEDSSSLSDIMADLALENPKKTYDTLEETNNLEDVISSTNKLLSLCWEFEDDYRSTGVTYHKTTYWTRDAMGFYERNRDGITKLKDAFILSTPQEYDVLLKPVETSIDRLTSLLSDAQHVSLKTTKQELERMLQTDFTPRFRSIEKVVRTQEEYFDKLREYTERLFFWCPDSDDGQGEEEETPWHALKENEATGRLEVTYKWEEWDYYLKWIVCLPEVRKSVGEGDKLEDIALCMLDMWQDDKRQWC
jgi:hypothetical protein